MSSPQHTYSLTDDAGLPQIEIRTAAVVAAPGFGIAFDAGALARVTAPVQLWAAEADRNVPLASNAAVVRDALPAKPDFGLVVKAGHFAFMPPCNPLLKTHNPRVWNMVCIDDPAFDRVAFHAAFNAEVLAFFDSGLGGS